MARRLHDHLIKNKNRIAFGAMIAPYGPRQDKDFLYSDPAAALAAILQGAASPRPYPVFSIHTQYALG